MSESLSWPDGLWELTDDSVEEFVSTYPVALVEVGAEWCPPCQELEPRLEELAEELAGEVAIGSVDIDEHGDLTEHRGTVSRALDRLPGTNAPIPALFLFADGDLADKSVGEKSKDELREWLDDHR